MHPISKQACTLTIERAHSLLKLGPSLKAQQLPRLGLLLQQLGLVLPLLLQPLRSASRLKQQLPHL